MQRCKFALKLTAIAVMLGASFSHTLAYAESRQAGNTQLVFGHAPYIEKIAVFGELYEGNTITLKPKSGRIYLPKDADLDIRDLNEETDTYVGDISLEGEVIEWWLLPADYASERLPINNQPENLTGKFAGAELIEGQKTTEVVLPVGSAGKKLGFRVTPRSAFGLPSVGRRLEVLDSAFIAGQTEDGQPITPDERGPAQGPDPENPGIIGGDTEVTYYTRIYTYEADADNTEVDPLLPTSTNPAGTNTDGKKVFLWDETGLTPSNQIKPFADTYTTYYAQIVSFKGEEVKVENLVDETEKFKDSIVWRLKLEGTEGTSTYIRLDGTQTTNAATAEAIDTTGQISFTTQMTNKFAQVITGSERSEQGTKISFVYDDGKEPDVQPESEPESQATTNPASNVENETLSPTNTEEVTDETTP